jgi:hypothetical protein
MSRNKETVQVLPHGSTRLTAGCASWPGAGEADGHP